jgi:hypothetical protein
MSSEIFGSCDERELLWRSWLDARCMLESAQRNAVQFFRIDEDATRSALNTHMAKHDCGRPVAEPEIAIVAKAS